MREFQVGMCSSNPCLGCESWACACCHSWASVLSSMQLWWCLSTGVHSWTKPSEWVDNEDGSNSQPSRLSHEQQVPNSSYLEVVCLQILVFEFVMEMLGQKDVELSTQQRKASTSIPRTLHSRHNDNSSELNKLCSNPGGHWAQWDVFKRCRFPGLWKNNRLGHGGGEAGEGFLSWVLQVPFPHRQRDESEVACKLFFLQQQTWGG